MKIVRDGKEYELTWQEIYEAYQEQEHEFYVEDVHDYLEMIDPDDRPELTEKQIERVARLFKARINGEDDYRHDCIWNAIQEVMRANVEKEDEENEDRA